jgi:hypothetical protein
MDWKERLKALVLETGVGSSRTRQGVQGVGSTRTRTTAQRRKRRSVTDIDMSPEAQRKYYSDMNRAEHGDIDNPPKPRKT